MTAPFAPPPSRLMVSIVLAMIVMAVLLPFGRRNDWLGWCAFLSVMAFAIGLWGLLLWNGLSTILHWWRDQQRPRL